MAFVVRAEVHPPLKHWVTFVFGWERPRYLATSEYDRYRSIDTINIQNNRDTQIDTNDTVEGQMEGQKVGWLDGGVEEI